MKAILCKGAVACAAMLMGVNVMAQENVFVEKTGVNFTGYVNLIPNELLAEMTNKLLIPIKEEDATFGYQVLNEDLEVEKEFNLFTAEEYNNTRWIIEEQLDTEGNWVETSKRSSTCRIPSLFYISETHDDESYDMISQTLFNNDAKYEIIIPVYGGEFIESNSNNSSSRTVYKNYAVTSVNIVSETGEILQTINAEENEFFFPGYDDSYIIKIGNKTYFVLGVGNVTVEHYYWFENADYYRWYEICKETNSVNFVRETRGSMNIRPTIANRDEQITITLDDDNNVARELIITGVNGQLVERRTIPVGERTIQMNAAMMRSGMYNFTLQKKGEVVDNGKVIVK